MKLYSGQEIVSRLLKCLFPSLLSWKFLPTFFLLAEYTCVTRVSHECPVSSRLHQHWVLVPFIFFLECTLHPFYVKVGNGTGSPHLESGRFLWTQSIPGSLLKPSHAGHKLLA